MALERAKRPYSGLSTGVFLKLEEPCGIARKTLRQRGCAASAPLPDRGTEWEDPGVKGDGRGFPKEMVPSARDGDGDSVVCER